MEYINAFWVGGLICVIGQILIDKTKLTPARILVSFVCAGVVLTLLGAYKPLVDFAGALFGTLLIWLMSRVFRKKEK